MNTILFRRGDPPTRGPECVILAYLEVQDQGNFALALCDAALVPRVRIHDATDPRLGGFYGMGEKYVVQTTETHIVRFQSWWQWFPGYIELKTIPERLIVYMKTPAAVLACRRYIDDWKGYIPEEIRAVLQLQWFQPRLWGFEAERFVDRMRVVSLHWPTEKLWHIWQPNFAKLHPETRCSVGNKYSWTARHTTTIDKLPAVCYALRFRARPPANLNLVRLSLYDVGADVDLGDILRDCPNLRFVNLTDSYAVVRSLPPGHTHLQLWISSWVQLQATEPMTLAMLVVNFSGGRIHQLAHRVHAHVLHLNITPQSPRIPDLVTMDRLHVDSMTMVRGKVSEKSLFQLHVLVMQWNQHDNLPMMLPKTQFVFSGSPPSYRLNKLPNVWHVTTSGAPKTIKPTNPWLLPTAVWY